MIARQRPTGRAPLDLAGETFGLLTVVRRYAPEKSLRYRFWLCRCACGGEATATTRALRGRRVRSCGCLRRAASAEKLRRYNTRPERAAKAGGR